MTYEKCITYFNDNKICRNQDDINLTTNEYVYNRYKDGCNHAIGCFINANGTTGDGLGRYSKNVFITNEIFKNSEIDRHGRYWA